MKQIKQIITWLEEDDMRMHALRTAASLDLHDWCIAAGFVRNLVWDKLHKYSSVTPLNDIDLIYFDRDQMTAKADLRIENTLQINSGLPWSVKNQARMHIRNDDIPYTSTSHAMKHWVELETAIGVKLSKKGYIELVAPFGFELLFSNTVTMNPNSPKPAHFKQRLESKHWLELWPKLRVDNGDRTSAVEEA